MRTSTAITDRIDGAGRRRLALLCAAQFMLIIDVVVVNVAIPSIRAGLSLPDGRLALVSVAYTLTFGSLLIVFGRAGDLFGRRRLFLIGLALFTLASLATGLAQTEWQLIAARAVQGVGAAMVSSTALALLTTAFPEGAIRNRALGYWAAVGAVGAVTGQLLGGVITGLLGWRWVFLINVPVGLAILIVAGRHLHESRADGRQRLDIRGAILLTIGLAAAALALTRFAEGRQPGQATLLAVVAAGSLLWFGLVERRHAAPLLERRLLRTGNVATATALLAVNAGTLAATLFFTTLYLQVVLGYSPLAVGVAFAPITLLILLISPRAGALTTRYGPRRLLMVGFALLAAGMLVLARVPVEGSYPLDVFPALALLAVGAGLAYAPTFIAGTSEVPDHSQGVASGLLNSAQELGTAIGVTILGAIATAATVGGDLAALTGGYRVALLVAAAALAASMLLVGRLPAAAPSARR